MNTETNKEIRIDACFSPYLYPVYKDQESIVVIIDIFRATSAICTAFEHGAEQVIPVATVDEAREYKNKGYLVGAERDAITVEGFDFGNSPYSYMDEKLKGQKVVITTTNGTQAIHAAKDAYKVVIGSFLNIDSLCDYLVEEKRNVLLLCSGWKNKFNLEDALFAGAVTEAISNRCDLFRLGDACLALKYLYEMAKVDPNRFLRKSSHKKRLADLNLKKDIKYCLTPNQTKVIPILKNNVLINMSPVLT
ncbi:MAG TPA: 2-phosphosulfolactate phosphatase [Bacteroidia bacterium]|nr:2-phosphosulfolactate phosphatase [Bacteroidia bacterium]HNT80165.1 2-phosphosulfolactate phosphatase [Bacteroidia bacterium]